MKPLVEHELQSCRDLFIEEFSDESKALAFVSVYLAITIIGILGNLFVIAAILSLSRLRTTQNMFVFNLCLANILLGSNAVFLFLDSFAPKWYQQRGVCKVLAFIHLVPCVAIVLSMTVIAKNRHWCITKTRQRTNMFSKRKTALYLFIVWIVTLLVCLPILLNWVSVKQGVFCSCCVYFIDNLEYGISISAASYFIPNLLIAYFYITIFIHVRKSRRRLQQVRTHAQIDTSPRAQKQQGVHVRLAVHFIVVFLMFNICYAPAMIQFWIAREDYNIPVIGRGVIMIIFGLNQIVNPIAYFYFNLNARQATQESCFTNRCRRSRIQPLVVPPNGNHNRLREALRDDDVTRDLGSRRISFISEEVHVNSRQVTTVTEFSPTSVSRDSPLAVKATVGQKNKRQSGQTDRSTSEDKELIRCPIDPEDQSTSSSICGEITAINKASAWRQSITSLAEEEAKMGHIKISHNFTKVVTSSSHPNTEKQRNDHVCDSSPTSDERCEAISEKKSSNTNLGSDTGSPAEDRIGRTDEDASVTKETSHDHDQNSKPSVVKRSSPRTENNSE